MHSGPGLKHATHTVTTHRVKEQVEEESSLDQVYTMLTHNRTVAPDRHVRAHWLVMGKYGSISYIISKQSMDTGVSHPLLDPEKTALKEARLLELPPTGPRSEAQCGGPITAVGVLVSDSFIERSPREAGLSRY